MARGYAGASRTYVIAEAGVNHNGDVGKARELVHAALETGADAVKFQTWLPGELTGRFSRSIGYIKGALRPNEDRSSLSERLRLSHRCVRLLHIRAPSVLPEN
jgi:sialic acid synthase SpsE